ncbi:ATP-binding protein [Patulibacter sp.]|uniref:ATP-binding protein n=1 Tax=Patulibacter sp. TaxID=1912859 RepID=UPI00271B0AC4|nr:ATP-binding protein [Patulibacter sp.]MDO9409497.1 CHASE3 domain-containing protein [Patulibacter sp.]
MKHRLTPVIAAVSVVVAVLIGAILATLTVAVVQLRDAGREAAQAERTVAVANRIERTVLDLETGGRGFLIAGDERFLAPYTAARRALPSLLEWLESASEDPVQDRRATAISRLIREYESDWLTPSIRLARRDLRAARRRTAGGEGKERVDELRARFSTFLGAEQARADDVRRDADAAGRRGVALGIGGGIVSVLLVLGSGGYLLALVVLPVRRLARAVHRVQGGDLQTEVEESGAGEVGDLARRFNAMSRSLQEHHDELEGQTAEVEAQRDDIERTISELEDEKAWVETLFGFVERLVAESDLGSVSAVALGEAARQARADVGALRVVDDEGRLELTAVVGLGPDALPRTIDQGGGVGGRAAAERRPVVLSHDDAGLLVEGLGGPAHPVRVRHELHLPLHRGTALLGILVVARVVDRPFTPEEVERVRGLTEQAAVAIAKAVEERRATRLAAVNTAVLDATSFGVIMYDREDRVAVVNRRMRELAAILRMPVGSDIGPRAERMVELAVDPVAARTEIEQMRRDPSRSVRLELHEPESDRWFVARTDAVRDAEGALLGRIVSFRESTHEHEVQRVRDEFVATVTHELRTPLSSVVAAVDLLEDETGEPTSGQRHWTGMIRRNVDRLLRLVDDLLTVARAESGEFTLHPQPADLATIAADAAASIRASAEGKGVDVVLEVVPAPLQADVTRLAQACDNLLANAVKFTPSGGRVRLRVTRATGATVALEVADSGVGIPEAERLRLFERFYRTPSATRDAVPGTGLGLTITKAIVEAHGGTVRVQDGIDGGTAFVVELPVAGPPDVG